MATYKTTAEAMKAALDRQTAEQCSKGRHSLCGHRR